jgi:peptide/nickel transport system permease protein
MAEEIQGRPTARVVKLTGKEKPTTIKEINESLTARALRYLSRHLPTQIATFVLLLIILMTIFASQITNALNINPNSTNPAIRLLAPGSPGHILGTDDLGRDYLARLLYGGGVSLRIGFLGALLTLTIGVSIGLMTGYFGGLLDDIVNWVITTLDSIPALYLLILISALLRPGEGALILVIAFTSWTGATRLIRGLTIASRGLDYIVGARAVGASNWRIITRHIMPNTLPYILLALSAAVGGLIIAESTLSFLNLGIQPPNATWGNMLSNAQLFFRNGPHLAIIPGMMIFITVLCLYTIGDGLRDAFDPRTHS